MTRQPKLDAHESILGINTSAVNRLAVSDELPEVDKYV